MKSLIMLFFALIPLIGNCKKAIKIPTNNNDSVKVEPSKQEVRKQTRSGLPPSSSKIRQDQFLPESTPKSSLYTYIEKRMREELGIDEKTESTKFPGVIIDNQPSHLKDLNNIEYNQTKKITILGSNDPSIVLYGARAINGMIIIEMK